MSTVDKICVRVFTAVGGSGAPAFWTTWLDRMRAAGLDVEEVSAVSSQSYRSSRGVVSRIALRLGMYGVMLLHLIRFGVLGAEGEVWIATTNPFYAPWILATLAPERAKVINLIYDLYPDALAAAGKIGSDGFVSRLLIKLTSAAVRKSDATVFLGKRIRDYVMNEYGEAQRSKVIPVGTDCGCFPQMPDEHLTHPVELLYCGNLGQLHETQTMLDGLSELGPGYEETLHLRFHASGSGLEEFVGSVRARELSEYFTFAGPLSNDAWVETMLRVPIGLVLLKAAAKHAAVPSKVYSAMAAGQAILAVCPPGSDLADIVINHDCGWVVAPDDLAAFTAVLDEIAAVPDSIIRKRANAYAAARTHYCMDVVSRKWVELIRSLENA